MRERLAEVLADERVVGVIGLRSRHGHVGPHLFRDADELDALALEPRYPVANYCRDVLRAGGRVGDPDEFFRRPRPLARAASRSPEKPPPPRGAELDAWERLFEDPSSREGEAD